MLVPVTARVVEFISVVEVTKYPPVPIGVYGCLSVGRRVSDCG